MNIKIKKLHPNAKIPSYAKTGDGAVDLTAVSKEYNAHTNNLEFDIGLAFEIPEGHVGLIFPRSSICKTQLTLRNSVGVIDSGYRGSVKAVFDAGYRPAKNYEVGDRICQMIVIPYEAMTFTEVEELSNSERGTGSYGSTGS